MINYKDAEIIDILPSNLKETADVHALSYSVKKAMQKLQTYAINSRIYANIQGLPDSILDVLAIELRSQYYSEDLSLEIKRNIIRNTLLWYRNSGTPYAVEELIKTIFGTGKIIEWFDFEEEPRTPGTFIIETSAPMEPNSISSVTSAIKNVKNTRSHLTKILFKSEINEKQYFATKNVFMPKVIIRDSGL